MALTKQEFEKQLQSISDQSFMLQRIIKNHDPLAIAEQCIIESDRLKNETQKLNEAGKAAGII